VLISDEGGSEDGDDYWNSRTDQVLVTSNQEFLKSPKVTEAATEIKVPEGLRVWTDDFNNLWSVLYLWGGRH
jgi:hypothetical protein